MKKANLQEEYMSKALLLAQKAFEHNESPVGCVIVHNGRIIARAYNLRQSKRDATMHAEISAIRKACQKLSSWRLADCDLYVTLEPCYMCAGAIIQARIRHVYFGAVDPKAGAVVSVNRLFDLPHNHSVQYTGGILSEPCGAILTDFFQTLRAQKKSLQE
jgi:tRNA(adenine34) deaminase